jgi:uncharacterized membrane protein
MFLNGINMKEFIINWTSNFPDEIAVMLLAILPVTELRASVPLALTVFDLSVAEALVYSYIGNLIPVIMLFAFLPFVIQFIEKHSKAAHKFLEKYFYKLEERHKEKYHKYGTLFLFLFVAIPLPGSGVWTGSLLAILFNVKKRYAIPAIVLGMFTSGVIVLYLTKGGINLFGLL